MNHRRAVLNNRIYCIVLSILVASLFWSCGKGCLSPRLVEINALSETNPAAALDSLLATDKSGFSAADANYYDFLTVKATIRSFKPLESDSLILHVVAYAKKHKGDGYYPEALYTAGLVNVTLGDQPTALDYFHQASEALQPNRENLRLQSKITSQTGKLLAHLRINEEAESTILRAIEIDEELNDSLNTVYDCQLLAAFYQREGQYEKADGILVKALRMEKNLPASVKSLTSLYRGISQADRGDYRNAVININTALNDVPPHFRNIALAHASRIFMDADLPEEAYQYAVELINSDREENKACGYEVILDPKLRHLLPADSLNHYFDEYARQLKNYYDENSNNLSLQQQASYNYQGHQLKRLEAERNAYKRAVWISVLAGILILVVFIGVLIFYREKQKILKLEQAIRLLEKKRNIEIAQSGKNSNSNTADDTQEELIDRNQALLSTEIVYRKKSLRKKLQEELDRLYDANPSPAIAEEILGSEVYARFRDIAGNENRVPAKTDWIELEKVVAQTSADFKSNLHLLSGGKMKEWQFQTALLIKCGFRPYEISRIIGLAKSSANYRRASISKLLFDIDLSSDKIENIIRLM